MEWAVAICVALIFGWAIGSVWLTVAQYKARGERSQSISMQSMAAQQLSAFQLNSEQNAKWRTARQQQDGQMQNGLRPYLINVKQEARWQAMADKLAEVAEELEDGFCTEQLHSQSEWEEVHNKYTAVMAEYKAMKEATP